MNITFSTKKSAWRKSLWKKVVIGSAIAYLTHEIASLVLYSARAVAVCGIESLPLITAWTGNWCY